jgi:hypothetical protein
MVLRVADHLLTIRGGNQRYFLTTLGIKKPGQVNGCHGFLFKANHKRATASEGVEYKSSYPSYPDAVHRHFPESKIREKNFSPHAAMSSEWEGTNLQWAPLPPANRRIQGRRE